MVLGGVICFCCASAVISWLDRPWWLTICCPKPLTAAERPFCCGELAHLDLRQAAARGRGHEGGVAGGQRGIHPAPSPRRGWCRPPSASARSRPGKEGASRAPANSVHRAPPSSCARRGRRVAAVGPCSGPPHPGTDHPECRQNGPIKRPLGSEPRGGERQPRRHSPNTVVGVRFSAGARRALNALARPAKARTAVRLHAGRACPR